MKQTRKLYGMKYAAHISKQPVGTEEAERREKKFVQKCNNNQTADASGMDERDSEK